MPIRMMRKERYLQSILVFVLLAFSLFGLEAKESEVDSFFRQALSQAGRISNKQIKIPGYPHAYNPSLIPYKGGYLLSFRYISKCLEKSPFPFRTDLSFIGVVRLDKNFKVAEKTVQLLNILSHSPHFSLTAEDARLFKIGERIYLFFNDLPPLAGAPDLFAMYLAELVEEKGVFSLKEPAKLLRYSQAIQIEKNWSPFSSGDRLYLIYSGQPRIILEVDLPTGHCQEVTRTRVDWHWPLGEIRGGTPAYLVDGQFLTFFHSCFPVQTPKGRAYVMGAYTFDKDPPFAIRAMTPRPLGDLVDYSQDNPSKIVFPGGLVIQDPVIHVAWGKGDRQIFITTFDREKLFAFME